MCYNRSPDTHELPIQVLNLQVHKDHADKNQLFVCASTTIVAIKKEILELFKC